MTAVVTAFERSPDRGQGLARDMRVRWALEEVGHPNLRAYVTRGEARPACQRAFADQLAVFTGKAGSGHQPPPA